ncbi:MAG: hypothetical protein JO345_16365 [Streptosporangiaceae bacterium]|nr:hypothetical protein [Streptosporangiaceae bacterium]
MLQALAAPFLRKRKPYTRCNPGFTHFPAYPRGKASICEVGRDPQVDLIAEGVADCGDLPQPPTR